MKDFDKPKPLLKIRPDGYIGMITRSGDQNLVKEYLEKFLSPICRLPLSSANGVRVNN